MAFFTIEQSGNAIRTQYILVVDSLRKRSYWTNVSKIETARWATRRSVAFIKSSARDKIDDSYIDALDHGLMLDRRTGNNLLQLTCKRTGELWNEPIPGEDCNIYIGSESLSHILLECCAIDLLRDIFGNSPEYNNKDGIYHYYDFATKKYEKTQYYIEPYQTLDDALICTAASINNCVDLEFVRVYVLSKEDAKIVTTTETSSIISLARESNYPDGKLPLDVISGTSSTGLPSYNKAAIKNFYYLPDEGTHTNYGNIMKYAIAKL